MGQYHAIYNLSKKEVYGPVTGGVKLLEQAGSYPTMAGLLVLLANSNGRGGGDLSVYAEKHDPKTYKPIYTLEEKAQQDAIDLISGRWAGDKIVIQGDYAEKGDKSFCQKKFLNQFTDITELVANALKQCCEDELRAEDKFRGMFGHKLRFPEEQNKTKRKSKIK